MRPNEAESWRHDAFSKPKLPPVRWIDGTVAAINTPFCSNFHHWMLDTVPRIGSLLDAHIDLDSIDFFVFDYKNTPYQNEVLEKLGIPQSKIIPSSVDLHIQAKKLIVPSYSEPGAHPEKYLYTRPGLEFIRSLFLKKPSNPVQQWPKKILVSRSKAKERRLLREDEIMAALEPLGFQKVFLEDHSVQTQAHFFNHAETIIMPHGGGLANCAFCRPGTRVIELFNPAYLPTFMSSLSTALSLEYTALVGMPHPLDISISPERVTHEQNY
jgi:capsular polysaccharide biosynthesis protein